MTLSLRSVGERRSTVPGGQFYGGAVPSASCLRNGTPTGTDARSAGEEAKGPQGFFSAVVFICGDEIESTLS